MKGARCMAGCTAQARTQLCSDMYTQGEKSHDACIEAIASQKLNARTQVCMAKAHQCPESAAAGLNPSSPSSAHVILRCVSCRARWRLPACLWAPACVLVPPLAPNCQPRQARAPLPCRISPRRSAPPNSRHHQRQPVALQSTNTKRPPPQHPHPRARCARRPSPVAAVNVVYLDAQSSAIPPPPTRRPSYPAAAEPSPTPTSSTMTTPALPEDQARLLEDALVAVRQQTSLMRKCLDTPGKLMDALKCW